jgi:hypothetical protein
MTNSIYEGVNPQIEAIQQKIIKLYKNQLDQNKAIVQAYTLRIPKILKNGGDSLTFNTSVSRAEDLLKDIARLVNDDEYFYGYSMAYGIAKVPYSIDRGKEVYRGGSRLPFSYPEKAVFTGFNEGAGVKELDCITNLFMGVFDFGKDYNSSILDFDASYFIELPPFGTETQRPGITHKQIYKSIEFDGGSNEIKLTLPDGDRRMLSGVFEGSPQSNENGFRNIAILEFRGFKIKFLKK